MLIKSDGSDLTHEIPERRLALVSQHSDLAENGESGSVSCFGEAVDLGVGAGLGFSELVAGEGNDVEVHGPEFPL